MNADAMHYVLTHSKAQSTNRLMLQALAWMIPEGADVCAVSHRELIAMTNMSRCTIKRSIRNLIKLGELQIVRQGGGDNANTCAYRIVGYRAAKH